MGRHTLCYMITALFLPFLFAVAAYAASPHWEKLEEGLYLGEFKADPAGRDCGITVLKIDPQFFDFQIFSASEYSGKSRTIHQWTEDFSLKATINASMYQGGDFLKSTGYMRNYSHSNNTHINRSFGAFLVFNPVDPSFPRVQLIDRRLQKDWKQTIQQYHSVVQNYRMVSFGKKRGWPQQDRRHGTAAIGLDTENRVLFILSRAALSTHDLISSLLSLPLNIQGAMYVEGGPQAALQLRSGPEIRSWIGVCGENFAVADRVFGFEIPNVIGVRKRN